MTSGAPLAVPPAAGPSGVALLGVRHHGPGSARAVRAALDAYRPGTVLIEGPPEADPLVGLAAEDGMRPPVALLAHVLDDPARAAFWPFAEFSPEWVAIRWAAGHGVPVTFIDLPAAHSLALRTTPDEQDEPPGEGSPDDGSPDDGSSDGDEAVQALRIDPLAVLAETAGYDDPERWWEDAVEHRSSSGADPLAPFAALAEAMGALRELYGDGGHADDPAREAHMRLRIRDARRTHDRVAVVCGAWHVPALARPVTATADRQLLRGLPKVKVEMTWVPWTHRRLSRHSGYGAGIDSPGWYGHLFGARDRPVTRWMTKVAGLLRAEDLPVSSAHVIEAVRLADTLAAMRGRPLAGLSETTDAIRAVMCDGSDVPLALIRDRLVVGDVLGEVPDSAPAVPLARDLTREQRRLRLKPEALERELELDLRKETDAGRSRLLHRLRLQGIDWGEQVRSRAGTGTFRESWRLRWEPELAIRVAEAGVWGTTLLSAATAKAEEGAVHAAALADVTALAERCLVAGLPDALPVVMRVLADRAALETDVGHLAQALPALVRSARYGDVRGTDSAALHKVAEGLAERVCIGLPPACVGLDADGAAEMRGHAEAAHRAIGLLQADGLLDRWAVMLRGIAERDGAIPGLLRGSATRLLTDDGRLDEEAAARLMALALSPGTPSAEAAAWLEGFLAGGGMLLIHDERLLALVDSWLAAVPTAAFNDVLPLLRRTFGEFESGVRRTVGELVRRGGSAGRSAAAAGEAVPGFGAGFDEERVAAALPVLRLLLGHTDEGLADDAGRSDRSGTTGSGTTGSGTTGSDTTGSGTTGSGTTGENG
ncbi:DUF5682 family protein [Streptomyces sp. H39-C1]|nr:DUF5682 family protein [Streptomyces sp. H39-C1]MCZ4097353.1 DUF5682 family protein [Streptomyces sp. H39-C1]